MSLLPSTAIVATSLTLTCASLALACPAVRLAWDPNPDAGLAGYAVLYRSQDAHSSEVQFVPATETTAVVASLQCGKRYFFTVVAISPLGAWSLPSNEVSTVVGPPSPLATVKTYFAEGAVGDLFQYRLAVLNTTAGDAAVLVEFLPEGRPVVTRRYQAPAFSRVTIGVGDIPELRNGAFGAVVTSVPGVLAERLMTWDDSGGMSDATLAKGLEAPSSTWYLAEGNVGFFDTFILLANASPDARADVSLDFLTQDGRVVHVDRGVDAGQRVTVYANEIPALLYQSFGTIVRSDVPILVERAMYFRNGRPMFVGGAASGALPRGATHWFLAEGQSGGFFSTFVLVSNPNPSPVDLDLRYLTPGGLARHDRLALGAMQRLTLDLTTMPELANSDVSTDVTASAPVVVERSMYWPRVGDSWYGSHNSAGVTELGLRWGLPEGELGGAQEAATYILLANPGEQTAHVTLTFCREDGRTPLVSTAAVPPRARLTIDAHDAGLTDGERFGVIIAADQPIAVEHSLYWNSDRMLWGSGANETGIKLPFP